MDVRDLLLRYFSASGYGHVTPRGDVVARLAQAVIKRAFRASYDVKVPRLVSFDISEGDEQRRMAASFEREI